MSDSVERDKSLADPDAGDIVDMTMFARPVAVSGVAKVSSAS